MFDVAVIIPNYNGARFLREAIDSALNQSGLKVEVIVVDDGSTDESGKILESYGSQIRVFFQENKGAPAARNIGWKNAKADYIKFLDADDVLLPDILIKQWEQIQTLEAHEIPYGQALWVDENLKPTQGYPVQPIKPGEDPVHHILTQNPLTSAPLHRKALLKKVNGFDEELVKGQEFDLHLRLTLDGVLLVYHAEPVYFFRQHHALTRFSNAGLLQKKEALFQMLEKQFELINRYFKNDIPEDINQIIAKRYWNFGRAVYQEGNLQNAQCFFYKSLEINRRPNDSRFIYRNLWYLFGGIKTEIILNRFKCLIKLQ